MPNARPLTVLEQILAAGAPEAHAGFLETIGDQVVSPSILRCPYPIKTLLWRYNDLRPRVREGLEADLRNRWKAFAPKDFSESGSDLEKTPPSPRLPDPPQPVAEKHERCMFRHPAERREDLFDRFLGWLAVLLCR